MLCSYNTHLFSSDLWSSWESDNNQQFRIIVHPMAELKACSDILSCALSRTTGSSPISLTLTLVWAILLQAAARHSNCSSIQI